MPTLSCTPLVLLRSAYEPTHLAPPLLSRAWAALSSECRVAGVFTRVLLGSLVRKFFFPLNPQCITFPRGLGVQSGELVGVLPEGALLT